MSYTINIEGGYNIRDLGDHQLHDGRFIRPKVLIRSGNLDKITSKGQQQLLDYGLNTVIDLREEWEVQHFPIVFAQNSAITYTNLPLVGKSLSNDSDWKIQAKSYTELHQLYALHLDSCQMQIGVIIKAIAESRFPTIFHCHAGKDRTGIIAGIILAVIDVPHTAIAEDYAQSSAAIPHLVAEWREYALQHGQDMQRFEEDVASKAETMIAMLNYLNQKYGGVPDYLAACGVSSAHLERLSVHLLP